MKGTNFVFNHLLFGGVLHRWRFHFFSLVYVVVAVARRQFGAVFRQQFEALLGTVAQRLLLAGIFYRNLRHRLRGNVDRNLLRVAKNDRNKSILKLLFILKKNSIFYLVGARWRNWPGSTRVRFWPIYARVPAARPSALPGYSVHS